MYGEAELTVISLGGGVQSSVMALMAAEGAIKPMPDFAVFADTGWEPAGVYRHLHWLETKLPFPVRRVQRWDSNRWRTFWKGKVPSAGRIRVPPVRWASWS